MGGESATRYADFLNARRCVVRGGILVSASATPAGGGGGGGPVGGFVGPLAGLALNKSVLTNKNKNKNKNKANAVGIPTTLLPAAALRRLHATPAPSAQVARFLPWESLAIAPPPGPDATRAETAALLRLQEERAAERAARRADILLEDTLDVSAFTRPLGIDGVEGYEATKGLFQAVLTLCEYVGLLYKERFGRPRPNLVEPRLRPLLPNPPHLAYPSNHAFQCFSIAHAFTSLLPEHPATSELFVVARRVAENREWAGLHYRSDTEAGVALARRFGPYLLEACAEELAETRREWL